MGRRAKGAEREELVVRAASELIAERGLADLRMADIAQHADMSVGHVTYYFPSKAGLLVRAIEKSEREFQAKANVALEAFDLPWDRFRALVEMAAADEPADRGWLLWFEVWAMAGVDAQVAATRKALDGWWQATMLTIVRDGQARGHFECEDAESATAVLSALTDGLSVQLALGGDIDRHRLLELIVGTARDVLGVRT